MFFHSIHSVERREDILEANRADVKAAKDARESILAEK